jgi:phage recombination protein Bet
MNAVVESVTLPAPVARRGITEPQWRTMMNTIFPGANPESVLMYWDYCIARKLDPLKKPGHIVPMRVKDSRSGEYVWRDVVLPGIYEYRTTATRTGLYMGHSKPVYGPDVDFLGVRAPEWCEMTIYRWSIEAKQRIEFPVRIYFRECAATTKDRKTGEVCVNDRWTRAPIQMLTKVAEAAGLRESFPDELGGTHTDDEMAGQVLDATPQGGDRSGRPDTSEVDFDLRDKWIRDITDLIGADKDEYDIADGVRAIGEELNKFPELYTSVLDKLAAERIITKSNWNKTLKHFRPDPVAQVPERAKAPTTVTAKPVPAAKPITVTPAPQPQGSDDDVF